VTCTRACTGITHLEWRLKDSNTNFVWWSDILTDVLFTLFFRLSKQMHRSVLRNGPQSYPTKSPFYHTAIGYVTCAPLTNKVLIRPLGVRYSLLLAGCLFKILVTKFHKDWIWEKIITFNISYIHLLWWKESFFKKFVRVEEYRCQNTLLSPVYKLLILLSSPFFRQLPIPWEHALNLYAPFQIRARS
jgi:hypothetical protein